MNSPPVRRRHVLFFGGFDPKGAAWYHGLYRRHAAQQATVNGMQIDVGPRRRDAAGIVNRRHPGPGIVSRPTSRARSTASRPSSHDTSCGRRFVAAAIAATAPTASPIATAVPVTR